MADEKKWVSLDPNLVKIFGPAGTIAIETAFNTGETVFVPPEIAAITGMLGLAQRMVNLDQTARNILASPRSDELEDLAKLANEEDQWSWALARARQLALEAGYSVGE